MRPLFTIHAGEYLTGAFIEKAHPRWNVWVPSKDTGVDLLVTDERNRKTVSLQVKFSKDFNPTHSSPLDQTYLQAAGWWTLDTSKIRKSKADLWVFVLPAFVEKETNFIILPPAELLHRLKAIHGSAKKNVHSYLRVTKKGKCWDARGLPKADQELMALGRFKDKNRDFTQFLNAWKQIEKRLR